MAQKTSFGFQDEIGVIQGFEGFAYFSRIRVEQQRTDADFKTKSRQHARFFRAAGEGVNDAALGKTCLLDGGGDVGGSFEIMDNHAAAQGLCNFKLAAEDLDLPFALRRRLGFVVKIQADFANLQYPPLPPPQ